MKRSKLRGVILAVLLVVFSMMSMVGCGTSKSTTSDTPTKAPEATKAAEPTEVAKKIVVGVSMNSLDEYATNWINTFTKMIEEKGGTVITTNADTNASKQISDVDSLIAQKPDVIIIRPQDSAAVEPAGEAVKTSGIPLIVVDGAMPDLGYGISLTVDQGVNGELLGDYLNKWLDEDSSRVAKVGYIVGIYADIVMPRMNKIFETCPRAEKVIDVQGDWNADKGMKITEDWLQAHPEINVIAAMNDEMAIGAIQALQAAGKNMDDYIVLGVDGTANGQKYIKSGDLDATTFVAVSEQIAQIADAAVTLANGGTYDKTLDKSTVKLMTKDNIDQLIAQ